MMTKCRNTSRGARSDNKGHLYSKYIQLKCIKKDLVQLFRKKSC